MNTSTPKPEWGDDHVRAIRAGCLPRHDHPIADTIDAAVLTMPDGWKWERGPHRCHLRRHGVGGEAVVHVFETIDITGHTPEAIRRDLLALARLAWIAEGATP